MWWIVAALILTGILFVLIEFLLIPGVGFAGIFGLACLVGSCVYAFVERGTRDGIIVTAIVLTLVVIFVIIALREKTWKRFELNTEVDSKVNTEVESIEVGDKGKTVTRLAPAGTARFGNISCEVRSEDNTMVAAGTEVEVVRIEEKKVLVKQITE